MGRETELHQAGVLSALDIAEIFWISTRHSSNNQQNKKKGWQRYSSTCKHRCCACKQGFRTCKQGFSRSKNAQVSNPAR